MPGYSFMLNRPLQYADVAEHLATNRSVGVPYTEEMVQNAVADLEAQTNPDADTDGVAQRYPKAVIADFDGNRAVVTEMDAVIAYLQMLGTLVDFREYRTEDLQQ